MNTVSLTLEVSPTELEWASKLFSIMNEVKNYSGELERKRLKEIKELINKPI